MIARILENTIKSRLFSGKAIILIGPRQVGKTTLIRSIVADREEPTVWLNGDNQEIRDLLERVNTATWRRIIGDAKILVIDEAQRIEDIGIKLKLVTDQIPEVQLIASGSSAFEMANRINEPLTGRKWEYKLYPLYFGELEADLGFVNENQLLEQRMIYGYYPEVVTGAPDEREILTNIAESYLFRDVYSWGNIRKPEKLTALIQSLAYQLGNEVSYNELSKTVGLDNETVENYIQLLERAYIIYRLPPLSRNLRKELKTKRKIYFYDNGIRNAIISQFQPLSNRQDVGALWENYILSERLKYLSYYRLYGNRFFWRTSDQQEIDYVEERDGKMWAAELKWNPKKKARFSDTFLRAYPEHELKTVNRENYYEFIAPKAEQSL
ncbi:MAG: ATP-binding protein [Bacteroidota bacterium]